MPLIKITRLLESVLALPVAVLRPCLHLAIEGVFVSKRVSDSKVTLFAKAQIQFRHYDLIGNLVLKISI